MHGHLKRSLILLLSGFWLLSAHAMPTNNVTILSQLQYQTIQQQTRADITSLQQHLRPIDGNADKDQINEQLFIISQFFANRPYAFSAAQGEGDWCDDLSHHCQHLQQDPMARTDQFDCQTYITSVLALLGTQSWSQFITHIKAINYHHPSYALPMISYINRNHFISSDFNSSNQDQGLLTDALQHPSWQPFRAYSTADINHHQWLIYQAQQPNFMHVFNPKDGPHLRHRFEKTIKKIPRQKPTTITYLPKNLLIKSRHHHGHTIYQPTPLYQQLPAPSIIEIVRNPKHWLINHKTIEEVIHSGILVSHLGLLFRHHFTYHELIYPKITCEQPNTCHIKNIFCLAKQGCSILIFSNATSAFPKTCFLYQDEHGFHITPTGTPDATPCNRVANIPLLSYLTYGQHGQANYMNSQSILGLHFETITHILTNK